MENCNLNGYPQTVLQWVSRRFSMSWSGVRPSHLLPISSTLTNRGVPDERPIPDLPIQRPDFKLLFGTDSPARASVTFEAAEKGEGSLSGKGKEKDTSSEGIIRRTQVGGEDVDVTEKLTMTWVSMQIFVRSSVPTCN